jgi:hypothetical protein
MKIFEIITESYSNNKIVPDAAFIGYLSPDHKFETFTQSEAAEVDYHHSHLVKDLDAYDEEGGLTFVRYNGDPIISIKGTPAMNPHDNGSSAMISELARRIIQSGANSDMPIEIENMGFSRIEAPYQGKRIGTLLQWAMRNASKKVQQEIAEACWKGYHKEGNKKMFGKTYPNCVKNEGVAEGSESKDTLISTLNSFGYYTDDSRVYVNDDGDKIVRVGSEWKHQSGKRGRGAEELGDFLSSNQGVAEGTTSGDSSLHDWFSKSKSSDGKPGWVQIGGRYSGKPCAKQPGQKTKPKCGSSKMKRALSDKEENAAARKKRREDPNPNRSGQAKNVKTNPERKVKEQTVPQEIGSPPQQNYGKNPLEIGIGALRMLNNLRNIDPRTAAQNIISQEISNVARSEQDPSSKNLSIIRRSVDK